MIYEARFDLTCYDDEGRRNRSVIQISVSGDDPNVVARQAIEGTMRILDNREEQPTVSSEDDLIHKHEGIFYRTSLTGNFSTLGHDTGCTNPADSHNNCPAFERRRVVSHHSACRKPYGTPHACSWDGLQPS